MNIRAFETLGRLLAQSTAGWVKAAFLALMALTWVGAASAQTITGFSTNPSSYTPGQPVTITWTVNNGNSTLGSATATDTGFFPVRIAYTCTPQSSGSLGTPVTCTGTLATTASDFGLFS